VTTTEYCECKSCGREIGHDCERTHQTKIGSAKSTSAKLLSGVIQRSGVGPLLFLTYIKRLD